MYICAPWKNFHFWFLIEIIYLITLLGRRRRRRRHSYAAAFKSTTWLSFGTQMHKNIYISIYTINVCKCTHALPKPCSSRIAFSSFTPSSYSSSYVSLFTASTRFLWLNIICNASFKRLWRQCSGTAFVTARVASANSRQKYDQFSCLLRTILSLKVKCADL